MNLNFLNLVFLFIYNTKEKNKKERWIFDNFSFKRKRKKKYILWPWFLGPMTDTLLLLLRWWWWNFIKQTIWTGFLLRTCLNGSSRVRQCAYRCVAGMLVGSEWADTHQTSYCCSVCTTCNFRFRDFQANNSVNELFTVCVFPL
jgi:hypothetical protein